MLFNLNYFLPQKSPISSGKVTAHFRGIKSALLTHLSKYQHVVGCVAWMQDSDLLGAFATREAVSIVIQKEEYLVRYSNRTMDLYLGVENRRFPSKTVFPYPLCNLGMDKDPGIGWRCVGVVSDESRPFMHHKFLVLGDVKEGAFLPQAVWTGSFNFTFNAGQSLENALFIDDPEIAKAYLQEYVDVASLSEPLSWESAFVNPEWISLF